MAIKFPEMEDSATSDQRLAIHLSFVNYSHWSVMDPHVVVKFPYLFLKYIYKIFGNPIILKKGWLGLGCWVIL